MSVVRRETIAGIPIPDSALAHEATELVREAAPPLLFDHSRRVFLWASLQGERHGLDYDPELLYVGAMFHDMGLLESHRSAHERFEIDGANAARRFLEAHGLPEQQVMTVWESIALHTTPEIPRYKQPEVRLVTLGVEYAVQGQSHTHQREQDREPGDLLDDHVVLDRVERTVASHRQEADRHARTQQDHGRRDRQPAQHRGEHSGKQDGQAGHQVERIGHGPNPTGRTTPTRPPLNEPAGAASGG